jgi:hypothetical protein
VFCISSCQRFLTVAVLILLFLFACSDFKIETPEGFAQIAVDHFNQRDVLYKAVSPEGIILRVKKVENYPRMELDFWLKALINQLQKEGYTLIGEEERFETKQRKGAYITWGLPYGNATYIYLTSLLVCDDEILITEAAGEHIIFNDYKDALIKSIRSISYK